MRQRLVLLALMMAWLMVQPARAQTTGWQTYLDLAAGYAFEYPDTARLSVEDDAVYVTLNQAPPYQGYVLVVLDNAANTALDQFLSTRPDGDQFKPTSVNGLAAAVNTAATTYWIKLDGAIIRLDLTAGDVGSLEPTPETQAAFEHARRSFRLLPRIPQLLPAPIATPAPTNLRPAVADQFQSPFNLPSTTQYETQWNIITSDTRYGIRNLALPGTPRKCFNVTWPRMLHSGMDLYRADNLDAAGLTVYAVADGQVAFYDATYASYPGRVVIVSHLLGDGKTIYSMYAHLGSVSVAQGQLVTRGQPIGTILYQPGDSHLHFEMRWFLDGHNIYPANTSCNSVPSFYYGRGYTYLIHPDNFPSSNGYVNPDAFIRAYGGPPLTPIGLPEPYVPTMSWQALPPGGQPSSPGSPIGLKTTAAVPVISAPALPLTVTDGYTVALPLIANSSPRLEPACVEGQNLLTNGGFEDGPGSAPWMQVRNSTSELIGTARPYAGAYGLFLGGRNTADEEVLQAFIVPYYTEGLTVTFKRFVTTQETEAVVYDHFEVVIENPVGNEISPQLQLTNLSLAKGIWVTEQAAFTGAAAWQNRRVRLSIKGMTDGSLPTNLYVDEVRVQTRCEP